MLVTLVKCQLHLIPKPKLHYLVIGQLPTNRSRIHDVFSSIFLIICRCTFLSLRIVFTAKIVSWEKTNIVKKISLRKWPTFRDATFGVHAKFHTDDVSLPRSGWCFWLVVPRGKCVSTSQKHYPDLGSDTSSVWNFCTRFWDVILWRNVVVSQNVCCFLIWSLRQSFMAMHNPLYIKVENVLFQKKRKLPSNLPISYCNAVPFFQVTSE